MRRTIQTSGWPKGVAYLDFWFIEPTLLAAIAKIRKDSQAAPKALDGHLITRAAMDISALARVQQQIQHILVDLRDTRQPKLVSALLSNGMKSHKSGT